MPFVAPLPRTVKIARHVVAPGDDVAHIAHKLTGDWQRWPELVGANPHKGTVGLPFLSHRTFSRLQAGEPLFVPGSWPNSGAVGQPQDLLTLIDLLQSHWSTWLSRMQSLGVGFWNVGPSPVDVAKLLYSWWPYLQQQYSSWPTSPGDTTSLGSSALFLQMVTAASKLIDRLKLPGDVFLGLPWDRLNLYGFPWAVVKTWADYTGLTLDQVWQWIEKAVVITAGRFHRTGSFQLAGPTSGHVGQAQQVDFTTIDTSVDVVNVPWHVLSDSSNTFLDMLSDPRVVRCMGNPATAQRSKERFQKMLDCQECYLERGVDVFVQGVCGTEDPCVCPPPTDEEIEIPRPVPRETIEEVTRREKEKEDKSVLYVVGIGAVAAIAGYYFLK